MSSLHAAPRSRCRPGGCRLEVRGVAAPDHLHCEPVPGRRAALPGQTLIGFDTASRRREGAFLLLFFFLSFSKREPFCIKSPSSALQLPLVLLCLSILSFPPRFTFIYRLPRFSPPPSEIKTGGLLFLFSSSFIIRLIWTLTSKFDPRVTS